VFHVTDLVKRFGDLRAVDGVSFEIRPGEIYGLLGPNGAGKTTTMSMLSGLLRPDDGQITFDGIDLAAEPIRVKSQLGVVPQETALYEALSARENLRFWGGLYGLAGADLARAVDRALDHVGLSARADEPAKTYSGGMKRRLNLALGLVHAPRAVLLDEPTVGIDPQARANILEVVRDVAREGRTVLYTTHYLEEAETLCDRIGAGQADARPAGRRPRRGRAAGGHLRRGSPDRRCIDPAPQSELPVPQADRPGAARLMRSIPAMIWKDLRRKIRAPLGIGVVLSFPIVFALMLAVTFGTGGGDPPRIHLLVENHDDNFIGGMLMSSLNSEQMAENFDVEVVEEAGEDRLQETGASALLRIPARFTDRILDGEPVALQLVRNPAQGILPEIAQQLAGVLTEVLDSVSRVLREPLAQFAAAWEGDTFTMTDETLTALVLSGRRTLQGAGTYLVPPVITLQSESLGPAPEEDEAGGAGFGSIFLFILPGISVYALFLVGDLAMRDLLTEKAAGTLRRQMCGPLRAGTLILGKALYSVVLCAISLLFLTVIGALIAPRAISVTGFVVLSLALILAVTGSAAALYGAARDETRGSTIGAVIYLTLAFAGGSFVQLEALPASVRAVSPFSPFYWGTIGFRTLLHDGGGLADILTPAAILAGLGVVTLALGSMLLQRNARRGVTG
jgi:ABC-2 type transport system ATP-binding protein